MRKLDIKPLPIVMVEQPKNQNLLKQRISKQNTGDEEMKYLKLQNKGFKDSRLRAATVKRVPNRKMAAENVEVAVGRQLIQKTSMQPEDQELKIRQIDFGTKGTFKEKGGRQLIQKNNFYGEINSQSEIKNLNIGNHPTAQSFDSDKIQEAPIQYEETKQEVVAQYETDNDVNIITDSHMILKSPKQNIEESKQSSSLVSSVTSSSYDIWGGTAQPDYNVGRMSRFQSTKTQPIQATKKWSILRLIPGNQIQVTNPVNKTSQLNINNNERNKSKLINNSQIKIRRSGSQQINTQFQRQSLNMLNSQTISNENKNKELDMSPYSNNQTEKSKQNKTSLSYKSDEKITSSKMFSSSNNNNKSYVSIRSQKTMDLQSFNTLKQSKRRQSYISNTSKQTDIMQSIMIKPTFKSSKFSSKIKSFFTQHIIKSKSSEDQDKLNNQEDSDNFTNKITTISKKTAENILAQKIEQIQNEYKRQKKNKYLLKLNDPIRIKWDIFIIILSIWNSFTLPLDIAFQIELFNNQKVEITNHIIDCLFLLDIILNFRTTYQSSSTGDEIQNPRSIAINYLKFRFHVDIISTIPFEVVLPLFFSSGNSLNFDDFKFLSMIKLLRVLRLGKLINFMNTSDDIKLSMRLFKMCFFLILYLHITGCCWYFMTKQEQAWTPNQWQPNPYYGYKLKMDLNGTFYEQEPFDKYILTIYNAILIMTGNDIAPICRDNFVLGIAFLILGALWNANIFGTIIQMFQSMNRKADIFQNQIDTANTSMKNMKMPEDLQESIREYMTYTQCNLDNQKELEQFLDMISPSLRKQVTQHICFNSLESNPIFYGNQDIIDFLINDIVPFLRTPEDTIIWQGQMGTRFFFIAEGQCEVWVKDHMKECRYVKSLKQGEYFGELALLNQIQRTATVKSSNYCTLASISKETFLDMCHSFSDIFIKMKQMAVHYNDPWKQFKLKLLHQVDYFKNIKNKTEFLDEIHYHMKEEFFDSGTEIITADDPCQQIMFVVLGQIELQVKDQFGKTFIVDTLQQGDILGQYSILFNEEFLYTAVATKNVRILTIHQDFFLQYQEEIDGLKEAIEIAEQHVEEYGVPICDFIKYNRYQPSAITKFRRAVNHVIVLNKINQRSQNKFIEILNQIKQKIENDNTNTKKRQLRYLKKNRSYERIPMEKINAKVIIDQYKSRRQSDAIINQLNQKRIGFKKQSSIKSAILFGSSKNRTKSIMQVNQQKNFNCNNTENPNDADINEIDEITDSESSDSPQRFLTTPDLMQDSINQEIQLKKINSVKNPISSELQTKLLFQIDKYERKILDQNQIINGLQKEHIKNKRKKPSFRPQLITKQSNLETSKKKDLQRKHKLKKSSHYYGELQNSIPINRTKTQTNIKTSATDRVSAYLGGLTFRNSVNEPIKESKFEDFESMDNAQSEQEENDKCRIEAVVVDSSDSERQDLRISKKQSQHLKIHYNNKEVQLSQDNMSSNLGESSQSIMEKQENQHHNKKGGRIVNQVELSENESSVKSSTSSQNNDSFEFSEEDSSQPTDKRNKASAANVKDEHQSAHNISVKGSCISAPILKSEAQNSQQVTKQPNSFSLLNLPKKQQTRILELRKPRKSILNINLGERQIEENNSKLFFKKMTKRRFQR